MRYALRRQWLPCLLAAGVISLSSCGDTQKEEQREASVRPAKLLVLNSTTQSHANSYPAVLDAIEKSELSFQVGGLIQELSVTEAQRVEEGHVIGQLDQTDYTANLLSTKAQYEAANDEYERAGRLLKEDAIARNAYEQRKSNRDVTKAALDSAEKALSDTRLEAPFTGIIAQVPVEKLQRVAPGEVVAVLLDITRMKVIFNLPARIISNIKDNKSFVRLDALPDERLETTFEAADLIADATSQTYEITLSFETPEDLLLLPGMTATLEVEYPQNGEELVSNSIHVPLSAVVASGDETYVWVVDTKSMAVSKRVIQVEPGIGEFLSVSSGLAVGETIVSAGANYLAEGTKVSKWEG